MEFKIKNEQMVQHYLKKVVELINTNKSIDGSNIILFDRYRYAITYYVIFNRKIPNSEIGPIIRGSLLNLKQYDNQNLLENFKIELNQQSDDFFQKKLIKYYLVIPTNFKSDTIRIKHFNVLDTKILIRNFQWIEKQFDIKNKELMHEIELFSSFAFFNVSNAFLVIEGYGRDERDFANRSEEIFEWFRSIMNFSVSYRSTPYIMWPRKPLSFIKESPLLLIFNEKKEYITLKYRLNVIKEREINFEENNSNGHVVKKYRKISRKIEGIRNEKIKNKLILAFKLYNLALDNYDQDWLCCFYLWQIMEVLFTTKQTEKHDVIPGRVVAFIGKNEPFYDIIRYFMSKRHSMIHRAEYDIFSKIDCDTMKEMVEFLILRVLARTMKFEDYHDYESFLGSIDYYLTNHDINDMQFSSYLKKKKEMSHLFERSRIFQN